MRLRLTFGPILILLLLGLMWLDHLIDLWAMPSALGWLAEHDGTGQPGLVLMAIGLVACGRAGWELQQMFRAKGVAASAKSLTFCAAAGLLAGGLTIGERAPVHGSVAPLLQATAAGLAVFLTMLAYVRHKDPKGAGGAVAAAVMAFIYVGLMLGFLMAIRRDYAVWVMVAVILTIKNCDSGAYFTGKAIGKHKLIPWLSPGKTWEGLIGGMITSALSGMLMVWLAGKWGWTAAGPGVSPLGSFTVWHGAVMGAVLGLTGQLGDLSASVFKRDAGIKDAGQILPGFGGLIDMLDSLLLGGPVAYWFFWFFRG